MAERVHGSRASNGTGFWRRTGLRRLVAVVLAYVTSRVVFGLFEFQYRPFDESFDLGKLAIDLGVFVVLYVGFERLLRRVGPFAAKGGG